MRSYLVSRSLLVAAVAFLIALPCSADLRASEPLVVAHRGLLKDSPENTMANFTACLNLGLGIEVDVQRSKDGQLVCIHDSTVNRTTNGTGTVTELTLQELKALDAGSWFSPQFKNEKIPTLEEIFALFSRHRHKRVLIALDLKGADLKIEADVVDLAVRHKVLDNLLMIGRAIQTPAVRQRLRKANSASHVATVANNSSEFNAALQAENSDWVYVRYVPTKREVDLVHAANKKMFIAGSAVAGLQSKNWQTVTDIGIDGILTDYAIELTRQLRSE